MLTFWVATGALSAVDSCRLVVALVLKPPLAVGANPCSTWPCGLTTKPSALVLKSPERV